MTSETQLAPAWVKLPRGTFVMGETAEDKFATDTERPAHPVALSRPFALGIFPVTVGEYRGFSPGHAPGDDPAWPVVNVTWNDARAFCAWLREETGEQSSEASALRQISSRCCVLSLVAGT